MANKTRRRKKRRRHPAPPGRGPGSAVLPRRESGESPAAPESGTAPSAGEATPTLAGWWKGALVGFVLGVPVVSAAVFVLSRLGLLDPSASFEDVLRLATIFAGIPAVVTAGGVGRLAGKVAAEHAGLATAVRAASSAFAVGGVGLVLLVAIPLGGLPSHPVLWLLLVPPGLLAGAGVGAVIGLWVGSAPPSAPRAAPPSEIPTAAQGK